MNKIQRILWPSELYLCYLILIFSKGAENIPPIILVIASFAAPLLAWSKTQKLAAKNISRSKTNLVFLLLSVPGILLGFHLAYGFFLMGHGENLTGAIIPIFTASIFIGFFSGLVGKVTWEPKRK